MICLLTTIYGWTIFGAIVVVCLVAFWLGERDERRAATLLLLSSIAELAIQKYTGLGNKQYGVFAVDLLTLIMFAVIAWRSKRSWPIWATSCQAISVVAWLAGIVGFRVAQVANVAAVNLAIYGVVASLAVGTFTVWREREALRSFGEPV